MDWYDTMREDETLEIPVSKTMNTLDVFQSCFLVLAADCTPRTETL